jgi:hypothetical protein
MEAEYLCTLLKVKTVDKQGAYRPVYKEILFGIFQLCLQQPAFLKFTFKRLRECHFQLYDLAQNYYLT